MLVVVVLMLFDLVGVAEVVEKLSPNSFSLPEEVTAAAAVSSLSSSLSAVFVVEVGALEEEVIPR